MYAKKRKLAKPQEIQTYVMAMLAPLIQNACQEYALIVMDVNIVKAQESVLARLSPTQTFAMEEAV